MGSHPNHTQPPPPPLSAPNTLSLPPPPPLQNLSPQPIPIPIQQMQLQSQCPMTNDYSSKDIQYSHICVHCNQGFMSEHELLCHKQTQHTSVGENTYYYPKQNALPKPKAKAKSKPKLKKSSKIEKVAKKKKIDKHNKRDKNGNFPRNDADGNAYLFLCNVCGKGYSEKASFNGHVAMHKRMEKMGKYYNKQSGKHEYKIDSERKQKIKTKKK